MFFTVPMWHMEKIREKKWLILFLTALLQIKAVWVFIKHWILITANMAIHLNWKVLKKASMIMHTKEPLYFMVQNMWIPIMFQGLVILEEARVALPFHQKKQLR